MILAAAFTLVAYWLYEVVPVALWSRTLGKQMAGLAVVRADDGGRPSLRRCFLRSLVPMLLLIGFFPLYPVPFVAAALMEGRRGPHDQLAGTRVVVRPRRPAGTDRSGP